MAKNGLRRYFKELRFQQLQGFCATARARSFSVAAVRLGLSRPALWQQVRELERLLGVQLVRRRGRGIELTEDGRAFLELAEPIVAGFTSIKSTFADRAEKIQRRLVVASTASLLANELRGSVQKFYRDHQGVRLTLIDRNSPEALRMVENGEVDLAIAGYYPDEPLNPLLEYEPLFTRPMELIYPRNHELSQKRTISLKTLVRYPFVMLAKDSLTRRRVDEVFERHGLLQQLHVILDATNSLVILDSVILGMGISILPGGPQRDVGRYVQIYPMHHLFGEQTTALIRKKGVPVTRHVESYQSIIRHTLAASSTRRARVSTVNPIATMQKLRKLG